MLRTLTPNQKHIIAAMKRGATLCEHSLVRTVNGHTLRRNVHCATIHSLIDKQLIVWDNRTKKYKLKRKKGELI